MEASISVSVDDVVKFIKSLKLKKIFMFGFVFLLAKKAYNFIKTQIVYRVKDKQAQVTYLQLVEKVERIEKSLKITDEETRRKVLNSSINELHELFKSRKITAVDAFNIFVGQTCSIGLSHNLITDIDYNAGLEAAKKADEVINTKDSKDWPELLGIPISIKDQIRVKGLRSTCGFTDLRDHIDSIDSYLATILRNKGAVLFVKSNVPQGLLSLCSVNNIFGQCKNPWNKAKSAGGSSGGEGGLVAAKCVPLGIGTDLAGSIRIPCAYNGLYGLKPTAVRVSNIGRTGYDSKEFSGFSQVRSIAGPMSNTLEDLVILSKSIFGEFRDDLDLNQNKFSVDIFTSGKKLKIGFLTDFPFCEVAECIKDVYADCLNKLRKRGHEIVEFSKEKFLENYYKANELMIGNLFIDSMPSFLNGEQPAYYFSELFDFSFSTGFSLSLKKLFCKLVGDSRGSFYYEKMPRVRGLGDYFTISRELNRLKHEFREYWMRNNFDAIVCPTMPFPALDIGLGREAYHFLHYCAGVNSLDLPAGIVPVGFVENTKISSNVVDSMFNKIKSSVENSAGMPITLQVLAMTHNDELCLRVMKEIDEEYQYSLKNREKIFNHLK